MRYFERLAHQVDLPESREDSEDYDRAAGEWDALAEHRASCLLGCHRCTPFFEEDGDGLDGSIAEVEDDRMAGRR